ncbi:MAG TPA: hypothetical protein VF647_22715 [Longimicrobium sp.]|jgi:hypothetical protein
MRAVSPKRDHEEITGNLAVLANAMREYFYVRFPPGEYPGLEFESTIWCFKPRSARRGLGSGWNVRFRPERDELPAFSPDYELAAKAWVYAVNGSYQVMTKAAQAFRALWTAIVESSVGERRGNAATQFRVADLRPVHLTRLERLHDERYPMRTTRAVQLERVRAFVLWLMANKLCPEFSWVPGVQRVAIKHGDAARKEARLDRLPEQQTLYCAAQIYRIDPLAPQFRKTASEPLVRLLICALGLQLVTGLRARELLTLPADCFVREARQGRVRLAIRFWNCKARGGRMQWALRWLSPLGAVLAERLLAEILDLTGPARLRARTLEEDQSRVSFSGEGTDGFLTLDGVARVAGVNSEVLPRKAGWAELKAAAVPGRSRRGSLLFPHAAVERFLVVSGLRGSLVSFDLGNGDLQMLSEALFVVPKYFFWQRTGATPNHLLVEPFPYHTYRNLLAGYHRPQQTIPSIFERLGVVVVDTDGNARTPKLRSHMLRHWINTLASKSGMSMVQITTWMQRTDEWHTYVYLHSASEHADLSKDQLRNRALVGMKAKVHDSLPVVEAEAYRETLRATHKVRGATCVRRGECLKGKACFRGENWCDELLMSAGGVDSPEELRNDLRGWEMRRQNVVDRLARGAPIRAGEMEQCDEWIAGLTRALAISGEGS